LYTIDVSSLSETKEIFENVKNLIECATFTDANNQLFFIHNESFYNNNIKKFNNCHHIPVVNEVDYDFIPEFESQFQLGSGLIKPNVQPISFDLKDIPKFDKNEFKVERDTKIDNEKGRDSDQKLEINDKIDKDSLIDEFIIEDLTKNKPSQNIDINSVVNKPIS